MPIIYIATANPDKLKEMRVILGKELDSGVEIRLRPLELKDTEETADTLEGNARLKAQEVLEYVLAEAEISPQPHNSVESGTEPLKDVLAIADDTGLEVKALGGQPGVRTARYAGENATYADNLKKLLVEMDSVEDRSACFRSVVTAVFADGRELMAEGKVAGQISRQARGDGGFGYDPVFIPDSTAPKTFAELPPEQKDSLSHRGSALRQLAAMLRAEPTLQVS